MQNRRSRLFAKGGAANLRKKAAHKCSTHKRYTHSTQQAQGGSPTGQKDYARTQTNTIVYAHTARACARTHKPQQKKAHRCLRTSGASASAGIMVQSSVRSSVVARRASIINHHHLHDASPTNALRITRSGRAACTSSSRCSRLRRTARATTTRRTRTGCSARR